MHPGPVGNQTGTVPLLISDASAEDWALIGVKVTSIALVPQNGGGNVTVYAPTTPTAVNLAQLDQISELLGNITLPVGTYTGAVMTLSANPGDVSLNVSADPEAGFAGTAGAAIPANQIQIQHTQGTAPALTTAVTVKFDSPLAVTASQNNALDLEFDLGHPAFIVGNVPPALGGATLWSVNFEGPVRRHPNYDITHRVLRHTYGTVASVATDNKSISITKDLPTLPIATPETAVATSVTLQILADATNGTFFYDVDNGSARSTIKDFSSLAATLVGKYVRVAARYQQDGTLVATRIWASTEFNKVWLSPEGHVLHVNTSTDIIDVTAETGASVPILVDANTEFFFRTPQSALADTTPIGMGPSFLTSHNLVRGFKVHVSVIDPLAAHLVAQTVDIETAAYDGRISLANGTSFTYTRNFASAGDDYSLALDYIDPMSANGTDASGAAIVGFKWWNFAFPTLIDSGPNAIGDFVTATNGAVNFGGTAAPVTAWGVSYARWGDPANSTGWTAPWTVLIPTPLPLGAVASAPVNGSGSSTFTMTVPRGAHAATVDVNTTSGSATLVYQVDRTNGVVTVSAVDVATAAGLSTFTNNLTAGVPVKVYGVPQADGTFKSYVVTYFTGTLPAASM